MNANIWQHVEDATKKWPRHNSLDAPKDTLGLGPHELASAGRNNSVGYTCTVYVHVAQSALVRHACALYVVSEHATDAALFAS